MNGKYGFMRALGMTVALAAAATMAGCGKAKLTVMHYPVFFDPAIKTVAVLPMANRSLHPMAGKFLADRLAARLQANGTYKVISPANLTNRLAAKKIDLPSGATPTQAAEVMRKLGGIDAFITGTVTQFGAGRGTYTEVYDEPYPYDGYYGYGYGRRWHRHDGYYGRYYGGYYGGGYYPVYRTYTYSQAYVAAGATMYRVSDAAPIYSTPTPARADHLDWRNRARNRRSSHRRRRRRRTPARRHVRRRAASDRGQDRRHP